MPTYIYKAMTKHGQIVRSRISDANKDACVRRLKRNGLFPITINQTLRRAETTKKKPKNFRQVGKEVQRISKVKSESKSSKANKRSFINQMYDRIMDGRKITSKDIRIFTQNFYLLKKASFNNIHALTTVIETTENPRLRLVIEDILYGVQSGEYMYTTMEYYSDIFPFIYINMIKVGELSGSLEQSLKQAIKYLNESDELKTKLRKILIPNIGMFIGIMVMLFVCIIVGLPIVQNIFDSLGTSDQLPAITIWFAGVVDVLIDHWVIPVLIIFGIPIAIVLYVKLTPMGKYMFDRVKYTMPIFGKLMYLIDFERLLKNMLLNLQNGIRIQDALNVSKSVINNSIMLVMVDEAINNIYAGTSWIEPFENNEFSNPMTIEMLKIGMQTDLPEMMERLIELMDVDIDNTLQKIMKVLPEVSYALVGAVLIFFVLVVLVPCIQIYMGGFLFSAYAEYM